VRTADPSTDGRRSDVVSAASEVISLSLVVGAVVTDVVLCAPASIRSVASSDLCAGSLPHSVCAGQAAWLTLSVAHALSALGLASFR